MRKTVTIDRPYRDFTKAFAYQIVRIFIVKNSPLCGLLKLVHNSHDFISHAAGSDQTSDRFPFVVSDREFVERSNRAGYEKDDVAGPHQNNVATLQPKPRVDYRVAGVGWQKIVLNMSLSFGAGEIPM
jgi:hypothetical protein